MSWVDSQLAPVSLLSRDDERKHTRVSSAWLSQDIGHSVRRASNAGLGPCRQQHLRRVGVFKKIDGEYIGHIATVNFRCNAVIKDNPYRTSPAEPEYIVQHKDADVFYHDLGYAWDKKTDGESLSYILVHLDDPSFPKTIVAVLIKGEGDTYNLYWDRVTISDEDIEKQYVHEELQPYVAVLRPLVNPPTQYLISIYPSLQEIWDPD